MSLPVALTDKVKIWNVEEHKFDKEYFFKNMLKFINIHIFQKQLTEFFLFSSGFVFSDSESTALEQFEGGPCAVIAPVQVIMLRSQ